MVRENGSRKTGVIAVLDTGIQGPTIAYRVDIDALPILESSEENMFLSN